MVIITFRYINITIRIQCDPFWPGQITDIHSSLTKSILVLAQVIENLDTGIQGVGHVKLVLPENNKCWMIQLSIFCANMAPYIYQLSFSVKYLDIAFRGIANEYSISAGIMGNTGRALHDPLSKGFYQLTIVTELINQG